MHSPAGPQPFQCAQGEWQGKVTAGNDDNFAGGPQAVEKPSPSPAFQAVITGLNLPANVYDQTASDYKFGETLNFAPPLPPGHTVTRATVTTRLRPNSPALNDSISFYSSPAAGGFTSFAFSINGLPGASPWQPPRPPVLFTFQFVPSSNNVVVYGNNVGPVNFPSVVGYTGAAFFAALNVNHRVDMYVQDDTAVDFVQLEICAKPPGGYLAIYKAYQDQTSGTPVPSAYASGFPIQLSCSSLFPGQITVPIKAGFFSSNDPVLTTTVDPAHSMTVGPSTTPSVPGTTCLVTEAALPSIQNVPACQGGSASWVTTYSPAATSGPGGTATIVASQTAKVTVTNTLKCDRGYLAIYKAYQDQTGGTPVPSAYTSGFPIQLSCSSFAGQIPVPIKAGFFSSNDPVLTSGNQGQSMSGASPSTGPSPAGISCTVKENNGNPLPQILTPACPHPAGTSGGPATWLTTFSPATTPTSATITIPVNGTGVIRVTNTLKCTSPCVLDPGMLTTHSAYWRRATLAQTFTSTQTGSLTQITHRLYNLMNPVQDYTLLVTTTTGGLPSWTSGPTDPQSSPNVLLEMTGLTIFATQSIINGVVPIPAGKQPHLIAGTQYALILIPGSPVTGSMYWHGNDNAGSYPGGSAYELNGTTWAVPMFGPQDHGFKLDGRCP